MNKITPYLMVSLTLVFGQVTGQTFKQQFNDLLSKKDTLGQQQLLDQWEKTDDNDPELYVAYFNYFAQKSKREILTIGQNPKGNEGFQIMDKDSANEEPVAYLHGDTYYDQEILQEGFNYIDKGLEKYPNRLDMRFGKVYMYGEIKDYENFTREIIKTIDYSATNNNRWTWADNKPVENPKNFMLSTIQKYQFQLYMTQNEDLLDNMKEIAETVLKYYPDHVESLSNLSIVLMLHNEFDKALEQLLKAHQLNPKDYIILGNLAQVYKLKGDKKNAIKYYKETIKYADKETQAYSKSQIEALSRK